MCLEDEPLVGFSPDVKAARKLVVLDTSERELVGLCLDQALYFYKLLPIWRNFFCISLDKVGQLHPSLVPPHIVVASGLLYVVDFSFDFPDQYQC